VRLPLVFAGGADVPAAIVATHQWNRPIGPPIIPAMTPIKGIGDAAPLRCDWLDQRS
jgi:hypothetical protein